jgi:hypothetical protein
MVLAVFARSKIASILTCQPRSAGRFIRFINQYD